MAHRHARALAVAVLVLAVPALAPATPPIFQEVPPPEAYGQVVLQGAAATPAVVFDHWRHRAIFTCRLCHVDVVAWQPGATTPADYPPAEGPRALAAEFDHRLHLDRTRMDQASDVETQDGRHRVADMSPSSIRKRL